MEKPTILITDSAATPIPGIKLLPGEETTIRIYSDTAVSQVFFNATRGTFLESDMGGEDETTANTNGKELLDLGLVQGKVSGGEWQRIDGFDNAIKNINILAGGYAEMQIRIVDQEGLSTVGLTALGFCVRIDTNPNPMPIGFAPEAPALVSDAAFTTVAA